MIFHFLSTTSGEELTLLETMQSNVILSLSILIIVGIIGGKIVELLKFPKVTGYILIGILIGPFISSHFHIISHDMLVAFKPIRQVAIGLIGYTIGLELKLNKIRETGKQVAIITLAQAFATAILVAVAVYFVVSEHQWTYALIFGAIATATAPAPIVAVVKSYRTKGPVTNILLPLVALDDAIGIMLFATLLSLGAALLNTAGESINILHMFVEPMREIGISLFFGAVIGGILTMVVKKNNRQDNKFLLMVILGAVLLGIGLGQVFHASAILLPMTIGVVLTNSIDDKFEHRLTESTDLFGAPIMLAFFTIAGAELELFRIPTIGLVGIAYIVVRVIGKVSGAHYSAKAVKAPPTVVKYLGFTLIPQAGVAIDMALTAKARFEEMPGFEHIGSTIMTVVLAATVVYEVFGLIVVKSALGKAGEIDSANEMWDHSGPVASH